MSFQAVGPEDPKERGPKLVVQDRGTSSFRQLNVTEDDQERIEGKREKRETEERDTEERETEKRATYIQ